MTPVRRICILTLFAAGIHTTPAVTQATARTQDAEREVAAERAGTVGLDEAALRAYLERMRFGTPPEEIGFRGDPAPETTPRHPLEVAPLGTHEREPETAVDDLDDKIVLPTTAVIIGLLVLIVILVAD